MALQWWQAQRQTEALLAPLAERHPSFPRHQQSAHGHACICGRMGLGRVQLEARVVANSEKSEHWMQHLSLIHI